MSKQRLVIGVTGATGVVYAVRLLQKVRCSHQNIETHLIVSPSAVLNLKHELDWHREQIYALADQVHRFNDVGNMLASGSAETLGMVVLPCSMRTLAAVAQGLSDNLITRAADVHLKERRRLLLAVRETPLNLAHLRNMTAVTEMGGIIYPPLPAFYHHPKNIDEIVDQGVDRILGLMGIRSCDSKEWSGL